MIASRKPLDTTCKHCQKSPLKTTTLSPKGKFGCCMMLCKVWSTASAQSWCCAKTSSQTISFTSRSSSAKSFCTSMKHIASLRRVIRILKFEGEVCPLSSRKVAMLKEATRWRRVRPVKLMPITCYIQRFWLTHLDHIGKILHLRLGLLC